MPIFAIHKAFSDPSRSLAGKLYADAQSERRAMGLLQRLRGSDELLDNVDVLRALLFALAALDAG